MLKTTLVTIDDRPVLLARPQSDQYGHLALEIQTAISRARQLGTDLYLLRDRNAVGPALYEIDTTAVRILRPTLVNRTRVRLHATKGVPAALRAQYESLVDQMRAEAAGALQSRLRGPDIHARLRRRLRITLDRLRWERPPAPLKPWEAPFADDAYSSRRRLFEPIETFLHADFAEAAERRAAEIGITRDKKLVCVHAREPGFKAGRDAEDKGSRRVDATRNATIESHFDAMDYLVGEGYTIARIGDPSMTPVRRPGVIDLATHPLRDGFVELFAMLHAEFIMCGESGPFSVAYLTGTPMAVVNSTCPILGFPVRRDGFTLLKRVVSRQTGRQLRLPDLMTFDYLRSMRDTTRFLYVENSPQELVSAAQEMVSWLRGTYVESPAQAELRAMATHTGVTLRDRVPYMAKHGPDRGFLGEGRYFQFMVDKLS